MGTAPFFFPAKSSFSVTTLVLVPVYFLPLSTSFQPTVEQPGKKLSPCVIEASFCN